MIDAQKLKQHFQEWKEIQQILNLGLSGEGRWKLLQSWLRRHDEWQTLVNQLLASDDEQCFEYIQGLLNLSNFELALLDPTQQMRVEATRYIGTIKALYSERLAQKV